MSAETLINKTFNSVFAFWGDLLIKYSWGLYSKIVKVSLSNLLICDYKKGKEN